MSFGFGSGFGGSNNNQQQSTGFGGFGQPANNNTSGFGAPNNTAGSSLFGGASGSSSSSNTGGGFGGFGGGAANTTSPFGAAKPAATFGAPATTGGSMFGQAAAAPSSGFGGGGGFGQTANNTSAPAFGAAGSSGGLFGAAKPAATGFGSGGSIFGGNNAAAPAPGGFGAAAPAAGGFGASGGFGGAAQTTSQNNGTGSVPFAPHVEKDAASSSNSHYQSITFQQPYQNYSFEELRVADYNAGRKSGNTNGQAGAFGASTGFGGFSNNNNAAAPSTGFGSTSAANTGGLFGSANNAGATSSPFGASAAPAAGGFGGGASGGGLFGAAKPATGGLFGSAPAASSGPTSGGLFGTSGTNTSTPSSFGGFGQPAINNNNNNTTTGGGLFGQQNNQPAKPAFGGFGAAANPTGGFGASNTSTPAFGQANTNSATGGGLFGQSNAQQPATGGGLFGQSQPAQQQNNSGGGGGGLFGGFGQNNNNNNNQQQQQQQQPAAGGGLFGGGGFGQNNQQNNQPKPGGLFGSAAPAAGTSLFGQNNNNNNQQPATGGGLFGQSQPQQNNTGGGLFGAPKPAATGGLFGGGAANTGQTGTGGGLFGGMGQNNQQQQNNNNNSGGGGLFGGSLGQNNNNNQQKPGGLFGGMGGGSNTLSGFGASTGQNNAPNNGGSLFGGQNSQQGAFGQSFQNQQQQPQQNLGASLASNPYGNDQLFTNLGSSTAPVGPLATPLTGAQKTAKRPTPLPQFKINPSASLRLITPQKRSTGYGLNYNTYGTPGSGAQGFQSNGLGNSLLQSGGLSRSLGKSFSTNNLRTFSPEADKSSVLAPGAFTPNSRPYAGGSIRRLKIDRNLRTDLFGDGPASEPSTLNRKRVSFTEDNGKAKAPANTEGTPDTALVLSQTEEPEEIASSGSSRPVTNGAKTNGTTPRQEMDQVRGNELAVVPEHEAAPESTRSNISKDLPKSQTDQKAGDYWMSPSIQELRNMSREQLKKVHGYAVGRYGVGKIEFDDVDLTSVPLDDVSGGIVKLGIRTATVYEKGVDTPPMGKGLNVPSTITLENSWPRSHGGRLPVHERKGPRFDKHLDRLKRVADTEFISYDPESGIWIFRVQHFTTYGLDDDEDDEAEYALETDQQSPTPQPIRHDEESSIMSAEESNPDDTFDFKKGPSKNLPGNFDGDQSIYEDEDMADDIDAQDDSSFLEQRGMSMLEDPFRFSGSGNAASHAVQAAGRPVESQVGLAQPSLSASVMPKSILKQSIFLAAGTPRKDLALTGDWAEQLQRTVSPKKQDRHALRERQSVVGAPPAPTFAASVAGKAFRTTMDIMNSLWEPSASFTGNAQKTTSEGKGFEWPYPKRSKVDGAFADLSDTDRAFHASVKPRWTTENTLVYTIAGNAPQIEGNMTTAKRPIISEGKDIRFSSFTPGSAKTASLQSCLESSQVKAGKGGPEVTRSSDILFGPVGLSVQGDSPEAIHERAVWNLAHILFDPIEHVVPMLVEGKTHQQISALEHRMRRDGLDFLWKRLVSENTATAAKNAATAEEKALMFLAGDEIEEACLALVEGNDFRIATVVAQLQGNGKMKELIKKQIDAWRSQNVLSEMSEPMRALYEIASGNTCVSKGKTGAAEDRASTFNISSRFGLDWRRSFGLRLWYGSEQTESFVEAVHSYTEDLVSGKEDVRPVPFFTEQGLPAAWNDPEPQNREDILFGLLKLYARKPADTLPIANMLAPTSVSGNPLDARLSWQLATILRAKGIVSTADISDEILDNLTITLATQLENSNELSTALHVLLHLSTPTLRKVHIRSLLDRRSPALNEALDDTTLPTVLTTDLRIPASWIWQARALHARAVLNDPVLQIKFLIRAGAYYEAHLILMRVVGPKAIISREYSPLREVLAAFEPIPKQQIYGWSLGGDIYTTFLELHEWQDKHDPEAVRMKLHITNFILKTIAETPAVLRKTKVNLEERVAAGIIAKYALSIGKKVAKDEKMILLPDTEAKLPPSGDEYALQSVELSKRYYYSVPGTGSDELAAFAEEEAAMAA